MSEYSGKCDIYDTIVMIHADGNPSNIDFSKIKIYAYDNEIVPLRIDCEKDLVPFYPYLEAAGSGSNGCLVIHLSKESFVDREERERLNGYLEYAKKYFRKCKRNKSEFDLEGLKKEVSWLAWDKSDLFFEIYNRVKKDGQSATIEGLSDNFHDYYRERLYNEMIRVGYEDYEAFRWCYGLNRLIKRIKDGEKK